MFPISSNLEISSKEWACIDLTANHGTTD
jgi:hypothetical protein